MGNDYIKSPLNYTGGKYKLLPQIVPLFPIEIATFVDVFCGGANVGVNINAERIIYNDLNKSLVGLLRTLGKYDSDTIIKRVEKIIMAYGLSNSTENGYRFYNCESGKGLGSYNKKGFNKLRADFNCMTEKNDKYYLYLFTLIIFAFNNQIRFNSNGMFNLPVGKRDFNKSIRTNLIKFATKLNQQDKEFCSLDFRRFQLSDFKPGAFFYCDPPYLITTASYNEMGGWTEKDEQDLLSFLDEINQSGFSFALSNVIKHKGKDNTILIDWSRKYNVHYLDYDYSNSSYHGKNTDEITQEVLITNY